MEDLKLATYITAHSVIKILKNEQSIIEKLRKLFKEIGVIKLYIENYRDGLLLSVEEITKAKRLFDKDFEVSGGVAIGTWGEGWGEKRSLGFNVTCISDDKNKELISKVMSQQAEVFDEIIIDDFWANWCYSEHDIKLFNKKFGFNFTKDRFIRSINSDPTLNALWSIYSADLLSYVSVNFVINPSRKVNKNVKIILKVAEWREDFYHRGIMLDKMKELFDYIYVGTESREGTAKYGSFYIVNFVKSLVENKLLGAWFDQGNGYNWSLPASVTSYLQQAWFSALSPVKEITLFHALSLLEYEELTNALKNELPKIRNIRGQIKGLPLGIKVIPLQPIIPNSSDRYIEDYLGMIGIPLIPSNDINERDYVLVNETLIRQGDIFSLIEKKVNLLITSAASQLLANGILGDEGIKLLGLDNSKPIIRRVIEGKAFIKDGRYFSNEHRRQRGFPIGPIFNLKQGDIILGISNGKRVFPAIYRTKYKDSIIYVLSVTKFIPYLVDYYPEIVRQSIRDIFYEYIGFSIESSNNLGYVSLIPFIHSKTYSVIIINMNDFDTEFWLKISKDYNIFNNSIDNKVEEMDKYNKVKIRLKKNEILKLGINKN